ncbi:MAG: hypothetical protein FWE18_05860 [Alphaproteobacteria bacterium]|nr:hypothetical protein [Alphaproteobacteria bacterium]
MKILKLLFAVAVFSFIVIDFSGLYAADEPAAVVATDPIVAIGDNPDNAVVAAVPEQKSFFRRLMFWKKDDNTQNTQDINQIDAAVVDEEMDPRLVQERKKPLEVRVRDKYGIKIDTFKLFEANFKVLNQDAINKDTEFVMPLDELEREMYVEEFYDRRGPVVMSRLDLKQSVDSYKDEYFPNFTPIGRVKVIFRDVPINEIKGYGAYLGANFIIMKKFFEPTVGRFVYDIMFLAGDIDNRNLAWYRNSDEAENLDKTLKALNVTNLNDYMNIITHNMLSPNRTISQRLNENYQSEQQRLTEQNADAEAPQGGSSPSQPTPINQQRLEELAQRARDAQRGYLPSDEANFSTYLLKDMSEEELFELQKALITFRVNAVVGLWEDVITGEVIEIRVLPKTADRQDLTYAAYLLLGSDLDSIVRFTTTESSDEQISADSQPNVNIGGDETNIENIGNANVVNSIDTNNSLSQNNNNSANNDNAASFEEFTNMVINKSLSWLTRDLKMQFSATSGSGFFMDNEKMVNDAIVYFHPAKGLIVVALPNKEFRYYKPIIPDMYPTLEESLYNSSNVVATNVDQDKIARFSSELESTAGTTNYFLYPGVTLGVIAAFLLIFI